MEIDWTGDRAHDGVWKEVCTIHCYVVIHTLSLYVCRLLSDVQCCGSSLGDNFEVKMKCHSIAMQSIQDVKTHAQPFVNFKKSNTKMSDICWFQLLQCWQMMLLFFVIYDGK